jgi:hypothetical protein
MICDPNEAPLPISESERPIDKTDDAVREEIDRVFGDVGDEETEAG